MKNKFVIILTALMLCLIPNFSFATSHAMSNDDSECTEITINEELDKLIMNLPDNDDKIKIINYFYLPAYERNTVIDRNLSDDDSIDKATQDKLLNIGKTLAKLSGSQLDEKLNVLINEGADQIINMENIRVTDEYLEYSSAYLNDKKVNALAKKSKEANVEDVLIIGDSSNNTSVAAKSTSHTKTFKKEYGSPSAAAYTSFKITATWKENGSSITSLSRSGASITKPSYQSTVSKRDSCTKSGKYGYVQRAWGYVNALYGDGKINGYYIIDVKLKLASVSKKNLTTLSPQAWGSYHWG